MQRRDFCKGAAIAAAAPFVARGAYKERQPNVILITGDDVGWRDLSCYGNNDLETPNIDALAEQGVRFTNAFVTSPSCSASRASIITGQSPHSVNVLGLTHVHTQYQMPKHIPTLPRSLNRAGYVTGIHGKWHVAAFKPSCSYGYDVQMSIMKIKHAWKAKRFISACKDRPFYLELNFMQPHRPDFHNHAFQMDPDFPVDPGAIRVPEYWQVPDWPEIREDVAAYYSQMMKMDHIIGDILGHLEKQGLAEDTLVIFVSDNGPPYPGCKMTCYDRGIGAALVMRWPAALPAGKEVDALVSTTDLMPTCLAASGASIPKSVQGSSLLGISRGEADSVRDAVYASITYHVDYQPIRAIRTNEWKYIMNLSSEPFSLDQCAGFEWAHKVAEMERHSYYRSRLPEELYHISKDPHERNNLAGSKEHLEVKQRLERKLREWRQETDDPLLEG